VSILPTFYKQFIYSKAFFEAFFYLQFGFVIIWHKNISAKAVDKMLIKLTTVVNFTYILQAYSSFKSILRSFSLPIVRIFWQKNFSAKAAHKMLLKLTRKKEKKNIFYPFIFCTK